MPVDPADEAALIFGVDVIRISWIDEGVKTVAVKNVFPLRVGDAAGIFRLANPATVILQSAVNPIRIGVVHAHMIELRDRKIVRFPPSVAAIVGVPNAAVVARNDRLRIARIDPDRVHIAVRAVEAADRGETFAAVFTQNERAVRFENAIRIFWIDGQVREIKRAPDHPVAFVALRPRLSAIIGNKERAVGRFDEGVNALRIRRRDRDREPAVRFLWESLCFPRE